jgi:hypothetical protein
MRVGKHFNRRSFHTAGAGACWAASRGNKEGWKRGGRRSPIVLDRCPWNPRGATSLSDMGGRRDTMTLRQGHMRHPGTSCFPLVSARSLPSLPSLPSLLSLSLSVRSVEYLYQRTSIDAPTPTPEEGQQAPSEPYGLCCCADCGMPNINGCTQTQRCGAVEGNSWR